MILVFKQGTAEAQVAAAVEQLNRLGLSTQQVMSGNKPMLVVIDDVSTIPSHVFSQLPSVDKTIRLNGQTSLVFKGGGAVVDLGNGVTIGGGGMPIIAAGPCAVEGEAHVLHAARSVKEAGAQMLRGGAFKPRTSPYDFQGLGMEGLRYLAEARRTTGLPVVSEVMSAQQVELAEPYVDVFQIGARNMYNYELLKEVGRARRPVLLKRGLSATIEELLSAAEYILVEGNTQVILCERGIRTFETHTRNTLDLNAVAALKSLTPLPVLVDPSHGTGRPELVRPMSRAAIACGADGLLIEVHDTPCNALSDGNQAITSATLKAIVDDAKAIYNALNPSKQSVIVGSSIKSAVSTESSR